MLNTQTEHSYGGLTRLSRRKLARPLEPKHPLHVVLHSSRAYGKWSLQQPRNRRLVSRLRLQCARKWQIRVEHSSNLGRELQLIVRFRTRRQLQGFLREFSGRVAQAITQASKVNPQGRFWDQTVYSRILRKAEDFKHTARKVLLALFTRKAHALGDTS